MKSPESSAPAKRFNLSLFPAAVLTIALLGAASILFGYKARLGAWLLIVFLLPVTFMMHRFWGVADPNVVMIQRAMFMKNVSMLGAALMLTHFGAGPFSFDTRHAGPRH